MKTILDYADLVKEQHALNTIIAPVETDLTSASKAYAVGQKFIYDGVLYQAKTAIAQGAALVLNINYEAADDVSSELEALTNQLTNEVTIRAALGAHNLFGVGNSLDEWFAATNDGKLPTSYLASDTITGTVDKDTNSIVITAYNNTGYRWGCKKINLKKNTRYTFSRTSCDGTIQLFGKNNADDRAVVISGLSNGGTVNSGDYDWWYVGFYPTRSGGYFSITDLLVKLETDADTTFQSYAKTNQELTAENQTLTNNLSDEVTTRAKLGPHNIMPYPYHTSTPTTLATSLAVSEPERGVIRFNGTAVGAGVFYCGTDVKLPVGEYEISKGVNNDNVCVLVEAYNGSTWVGLLVPEDYTVASSTFTLDYSNYDNLRITVRVKSGATLSNVDVKAMIKLASDKNNTWQSPAMTNRELTDRIVAHEDTITFNENGKYIFSDGKEIISARVRSTGNYVVVIGNNGSNSAFILYNHEGTNWTRVTTQPQLTVKWVEVIA